MKTTPATAVILTILVLLSSSTAHAAADKLDLKFHLEKGKSYKLLITIEQNIVVWIGGAEQETKHTLGIGQTFKVTDVDEEGTATLEVTFGPMSMKLEGSTGTIEYNSDDPPDSIEEVPLAARAFALMVGRTFTMKMTPEGRVLEIKGMDKIFEAIFKSLGLPDDPMKDTVADGLRRQFGEDAMKEMLESAMAVCPDRPVGTGESWSAKMALTKTLPMIMEQTWTLTARNDGVATVKVEATIKPNKDAPAAKMGPATVTYTLKGSEKGTYKLDETTGWLIEGDMTLELSGEITTKGMPGQPKEMSLPILIEGTFKFESK